ncbi:hypothetical protein CWC39_08320 [Corynebacterium heidelbergense]|uniref:Putative zinc-finger domain-containing protein n=1 Tax=Corynebacterium heidelbergense TaxID=2055947 RepID=A0A364V9Y3_9CORY|nr:hypothetical protein CWC39_08320 [Corynebacterium heidelbergense]
MECSDVRTTLSARLDGERSPHDEEIADAHLAQCAECQAWYASATALGRHLRMGVATADSGGPKTSAADLAEQLTGFAPDTAGSAPADPTHGVLSHSGVRTRQLPLLLARLFLVLVAVGYVAWGVLTLLSATTGVDGVLAGGPAAGSAPGLSTNSPGGPYGDAADPTLARFVIEAATARFALAAGCLWAAWRPKSAGHLLVVYVGMWAFGAGFATRDIVLGLLDSGYGASSAVWTVLIHLLAALALSACWLTRLRARAPLGSTLSQTWRALAARPVSFSPADYRRHTQSADVPDVGEGSH